MRSLDQLDARLLTGITGIRSPFISPDGHWVGFFEGNGGELKKVSILGGPPITLCKYTGNPHEASWGPDDTIIFATNDPSTGLLSVAAGGGDPKVLTTPDTAHGEADHVMPFILPGGRAVLFTITAQGQPIDNAQIAVLDLKTGQKKTLIRGGSDARYVDTGHLVYAAAGTLRAVRFDLGRLEVTSDPVPVVEKVTMSGTTGTADFVLSQNGTLVYVPGGVGGGATRSLAWVNRQGREEPIKAPPRAYALPADLARRHARGARHPRSGERHLGVGSEARDADAPDVRSGRGPIPRVDAGQPAHHLQFSAWRRAESVRAGRGQHRDDRASDNESESAVPDSISPDGTRVLFTEVAPKTAQDIGMLTLDVALGRATRPQPLIQTTFNELNAEVSPDGRWVAYQSNESGTNQVYVRPFPKVDTGHWQVSTGGGTRPVWARSGRELFYVDGSTALMVVPVQTAGPIFSAGNPTKLFDAGSRYSFGNNGRTYDVSADGQRFLMIKLDASNEQTSTTTPASLIVVEHWTEELKARAGTK